MKRIVILMIIFIAYGLQARDFVKVGTTAAQFLKVEVGARALGMAGSYASIANDANALYWNPAGIAQTDHYEATFTHTDWITDITHGFAGFVLPLDDVSSVGLSATYQTMGEVEQTTIDQPRGTGIFFDANDIAIGLTYARAVTDYVHVGITSKMIYQSI